MADPLVILSNTKNIISQGIVVIDYDHVRAFCRHGIWEGWQEIFTETVTLAYEHTVEEYVGWQVNDVTILRIPASAMERRRGARRFRGFPR